MTGRVLILFINNIIVEHIMCGSVICFLPNGYNFNCHNPLHKKTEQAFIDDYKLAGGWLQ